MSLENTRDIGKVKLVMLGGGGGGGSYTAGNGISITNNVITNTRKGALTGVIDSVSSNIAHTQITGARDTFAAGALILLQSEAAGTANNLRIQYGAQSSDSQTFAIYDTSSTAASVTIASGDTVIMMIDNTGYRAIILNVLSASGGSSYAGLGIGKKKTVTNNVIDTDIDLHRAPIVGDRLLVYFDATVQNPTGLTTYNNGTAVTSNLESVIPMYINAGWNILEFKNDGFLYNNCWVRMQNVDVPTTLSGLSDTAIVSPSDGQMLVYDDNMWKNKTYVEANMGFSDTELKKLKVGNVVYDTDGLRDYFVTDIANNNITISVLNSNQFVMENIAINTGAHSGSSSAWNLVLDDGMYPVLVALKNADGTAFSDDIHENELLLVYVDTAGNVARVLDIPVDTTEIKTVSGNPITLTDAVAGNAIEVSAEIVASQDLHGFDKPWVGGAGKNKLPFDIATIKSLNTSGTWNDNTYTKSGVSVTVSDDGTYSVASDGTLSDTFIFYLGDISGNGLILNGCPSGGSDNTYKIQAFKSGASFNDYGDGVSITDNDSRSYRIVVYASAGAISKTFTPMLSSEGGTFAPYTNICPISGFSSVVITDVDSESHTATVTVSLGSTVYGGTLDLTSGELTVTHANIASYNGETISEPWISSMDEYTEGGTPTTGAQVVYTLASPTTTTLTAEQLALVKGYNQLSCNSGDMEITYKASGLDALKERVDELEDAVEDIETDMASKTDNSVVGTAENGTTASQPYAVGEHFIRNDKFCTCISAIASGATLTLNTNYVEGTIAEALKRTETYSTSEVEVGTWNGKRLYRKMIPISALPNNASVAYPTGLTNVSYVKVEGSFYNANTGSTFGALISSPVNQQYNINTFLNNNNVFIETGTDRSGYSGYVVIYYTKNS